MVSRNFLFGLVVLTFQYEQLSGQNQLPPNEINQIFMDLFVEKYGINGIVIEEELQQFFPESIEETFTPEASKNCSYLPAAQAKECFKEKCLSAADIYCLHDVPTGGATSERLQKMCGTLMYQVHNPVCQKEKETPTRDASDPEVWLYSLLCVTAISLCSLGGACFITVMNSHLWKRFMMFMVALAVGTLAGSGILVLIPEAFELHDEDNPQHDKYLWISCVIMCGIYLFFLSEKLLKIITRQKQKNVKTVELIGIKETKIDIRKKVDGLGVVNGAFEANGEATFTNIESPKTTEDDQKILDKIGHIKSVAWMVVFGDALHNFIDGLAIGAAFIESTLTGVSVSLAVFCEELPHELGDFAILLNSGMSMRMALCANFLSACTCYLGLVIGINIGSVGGQWIFAVAGGMFLYISLADMLPEMNEAADEDAAETGDVWVGFFIQNIGIIVGFCIILVMSVYGGDINFG